MNLLKKEKKALKREYNQLRAKKIPQIQLTCHLELNPSHEAEHLHWGAYVDKDKSVFFRFATFSDAKSVTVEIKSTHKREIKYLPLENKCNGVFELRVNSKIAKAGDRYRFVIERPNVFVTRILHCRRNSAFGR